MSVSGPSSDHASVALGRALPDRRWALAADHRHGRGVVELHEAAGPHQRIIGTRDGSTVSIAARSESGHRSTGPSGVVAQSASRSNACNGSVGEQVLSSRSSTIHASPRPSLQDDGRHGTSPCTREAGHRASSLPNSTSSLPSRQAATVLRIVRR
jgi:hypothetical protein